MKQEIIEMRLGDVAEFINGGAWNQSEYSADGIPVVRVTNLKDEGVDLTDCKFLPVDALARYSKHVLRRGDLIIATVGSHPSQPGSVVGRPCIAPMKIDGALLNQNAVIIRTSTDALDQGWLGHFGQSKPFRNYVTGCARGSANQVRMAIGLLKKMPIVLPPIDVQLRIASILGAYDELIEVNRRRITLLEEIGRQLFEEWFVRFRFPGHEGQSIVETSDGFRPEKWQVNALGQVIEFEKGRKPAIPSEIIDEDQVPLLLLDVLRGGQPRFTTRHKTLLAKVDDTIMVMDGSGSSEVFVGYHGAIGSTLGRYRVCSTERLSPYWLYLLLASRRHELNQNNTGAAVPHANKQFIQRIEIALPPAEVSEKFDIVVRPIFEFVTNLRASCLQLANSRDFLLPRLLSGKVTVATAQHELEAVA
jgi:type I restriction enzyme S subunit